MPQSQRTSHEVPYRESGQCTHYRVQTYEFPCPLGASCLGETDYERVCLDCGETVTSLGHTHGPLRNAPLPLRSRIHAWWAQQLRLWRFP